MIILAIESSCDETSVAITDIISTQIAEHKIYGGVVPEIASRRHTEAISHVCDEALKEAGITYSDIDAVAVTFAPGLIGALLVGVNFAKGLAYSLGVPLIPVHHLRSHIAANYIAAPKLKPPFICLTVSGGNTIITEVTDYTNFVPGGRTTDDAAGECFDKTARALGLSYPGGVNLDKIAKDGDNTKYKFPKPRVDGSPLDFSFSGLKTNVINLVHNATQKGEEINPADVGASFINGVVNCLADNTIKAMEIHNEKKLVLAGGVSANSVLRSRMETLAEEKGWDLYLPDLSLCGDNGAMVGAQGYFEFLNGTIAQMDLNGKATADIEKGYKN